MVISPHENYKGALHVASKKDVINFIKMNAQSDDVMEMIYGSIFGKFFTYNIVKVKKNLLHNLLIREIDQHNSDCIFILIGGHLVYFCIKHFILITGLRAMLEA